MAFAGKVEAAQHPSPAQVFMQVRVHHAISGDDIDKQSVKDAIQLSESKYCSVGAMIRQSGAEITTTYSIAPSQVGSGEEIISTA
jgi:putative redox protein